MGPAFWIKRFFTVFAGTFLLLCAVQMVFKGQSLAAAAGYAALWAFIASTVFTVARFFQARSGRHCAICRDTPEMQQQRPPASPGL